MLSRHHISFFAVGITAILAAAAPGSAADDPAPSSIELAQQLFTAPESELELPPAPAVQLPQGPDAGGASPEVDPFPIPQRLRDREGLDEPSCWDAGIPLGIEEPDSLLYSRQTDATYTLIPAPAQEVGFNTFNFQHAMGVRGLPRFRLTPRFGWNLMDHDPYVPVLGVNLTDIPPQLYEVAVDFSVILPISERWSVLASVAPSLFTDFQNTTDGAFRIPSQVVVFYQWSEATTLAGGFVYLDREDITALGYVGVIFGIPGNVWKAEVLFPRARLAYRVARKGVREHWIYVAQEFLGGASWAMQHSYGLNDVVTYRDEKVLLGYELLNEGRRSLFVEGGYVYDRVLEFQQLGSGGLSSTGILRLGLTF